MLTSASYAGRVTAPERMSPELALVDRSLADEARRLLAEPEDTLGRIERELAFRRLTTPSHVCRDPAQGSPARWRSARSGAAMRHALQQRLWVATAVAAVLGVALLLGVDVSLRGTPAGADPLVTEAGDARRSLRSVRPVAELPQDPSLPAARTPPRTGTAPGGMPDAGVTASHRFAWAPVSGASRYHVELFREGIRVYVGSTNHPQMELPATWIFSGRHQRLSPGSYRWYVWPVQAGRRSSNATVRSALVIT